MPPATATLLSTAPDVRSAPDRDDVVLFGVTAELPVGSQAPEWVTLFPQLGPVRTRDGRAFQIDARTLIAAFDGDGLKIPFDVNHATDLAALHGGRSDAVAWGTELRENGGRLEARVDWLAEGRAILAARTYLYLSPSFYRDGDRATRIKAVALVTAPALAGMPALASAQPLENRPMKSIAQALGLNEAADEASCLSAVTTLKAGTVPKDVHEASLAQLSTATTELTTLKGERRKEKVAAVLDGALSAKKIVPAQRGEYETLCATDEGLASVERLFAATTPALAPSGLDAASQPGAADPPQDPATLAAAARKIQDEQLAAGRAISFAEAMTIATRPKAA